MRKVYIVLLIATLYLIYVGYVDCTRIYFTRVDAAEIHYISKLHLIKIPMYNQKSQKQRYTIYSNDYLQKDNKN